MTDATILIVDDNTANLRLLFDYLADTGYRVRVAEDGESALDQVAIEQPDLILMDVLLPGMSGFETCRKLKEDEETAGIPVIFLTALTGSEDKIEGFRAGGVDYLTKPLQLEEVAARISTHVKIRALQRELAARNRLLAEANLRKDRLFTIIAHDLRSPVAMFVSAMRVLRKITPDDPEYESILDSLDDRADRLEKLLSNLLDWAELQIASGELPPDQFRVATAVTSVMMILEHDAQDKGIAVDVDVPEELSAYINLQALRAVISNLVSNAIKFTSAGGTVGVSASESDDGVMLEVRDTGIGMSEEELQHLFRLDSRLHKAGTSGEKGSGLGLVITHELVERMGGSISAESVPRRGTTFQVHLPDRAKPDQ